MASLSRARVDSVLSDGILELDTLPRLFSSDGDASSLTFDPFVAAVELGTESDGVTSVSGLGSRGGWTTPTEESQASPPGPWSVGCPSRRSSASTSTSKYYVQHHQSPQRLPVPRGTRPPAPVARRRRPTRDASVQADASCADSECIGDEGVEELHRVAASLPEAVASEYPAWGLSTDVHTAVTCLARVLALRDSYNTMKTTLSDVPFALASLPVLETASLQEATEHLAATVTALQTKARVPPLNL